MLDLSSIVIEAQDDSYFYGFGQEQSDTDHTFYRIDKISGLVETLDYVLWLFDGNDPDTKALASNEDLDGLVLHDRAD